MYNIRDCKQNEFTVMKYNSHLTKLSDLLVIHKNHVSFGLRWRDELELELTRVSFMWSFVAVASYK